DWNSPVDELWGGWIAGLDGYDAVVFLTATQRDDIVRRFGEPTRLVVVPHALEAGGVFETDPLLVAMTTSLISRKRVDHVIRAVAALRDRDIDATLEVYGEGPSRAELEALINKLDIADAVSLLGY